MTKTTRSKMLSFLLCFVMIATTFCQTAMTVRAEETKDITVTDAQGAAVQDVTLPKNGPKDQKTRLTAKADVSADARYQWQILADADSELWVDIRGEKDAEISVSYPMVRNLIDKDTGSTSLRCKIKDGDKKLTSDAVKVTAGETVKAEAAAHPTKAEIRKAAAKTATDPTPQADDSTTANDEENSTYSIIINYVFEDGKQAANPWTATVVKGSDYSQDVTSPTVMGYTPDQETVKVDVKDIQADKTYTVKYSPAEVEFTVKHYQQNIDDDKYTLKDTETKNGYTESAVGEGLATTYEGFTALLYDTTTKIASDGSTVVEIYYDRNYYLMTFDLDGGYGVEPIYARYGTKIEVDNSKLKKAGYTFDSWDKEIPATMPAENTTYKATWNAGETTYLVQYWQENANDDGYSYESSEKKPANSGDSVSGSNDKSYTGFHFDHADQNVTVKGDGTSVVNVYYKRNTYTLTFKVDESNWWESSKWNTKAEFKNVKYGEDTAEYWNQAPSGYLWYTSRDGNTFYTAAPDMPNNNLTIYGKTSQGLSTIYYYESGTTTSIKSALKVQMENWGLTQEDYIAIPGFTYSSNKVTDNNYYLYYTRNSYKLDFNSNGDIVKSETIPYDKALSSYNFDPAYPEGLEEDAYKFDGWYTDPGYTKAVDWKTAKMPYNNTVFYAKWTPVTHDVKLYLTADDMKADKNQLGETQTIPHGSTAVKPDDPENGNYEFVGWFYEENGVEKAFDFSMQVRKNLNLYAKWRANTMVEYVIHYQLADGTKVAEDTVGSALALTTKTFDAKTGDQLNDGYKTGYFPETSSHSLTMNINGNNEFTFIYIPKTKVNYTVRYLEKGTNNELASAETKETSDAVITAKFKQITGYAPDAYQKRLVLSANEDENVLIFWYTKDDKHAPVRVVHEIQNIAGEGYTEYQSSTNLNGEIGNEYSEAPLTIPGFEYKAEKSTPSGTLTAEGLVLTLKYDRIEYPYEFRFLEQGSNKKLADPVTGDARYQAQVTQKAKTIPGYTLVSDENQAINIAIEDPANVANKNVRIFYYKENDVTINYRVAGTGGSVAPESETLKAKTGTATGSTPTADKGYTFDGWYRDAECKQPVDKAWVNADNKLTPGKNSDNVYENATYYAKFKENKVDINYKAVGPDGKPDDNGTYGTVSPKSETVEVKNGEAQGSTPEAKNGYRFVGWYTDEKCTNKVADSWVDSDNKLTPQKEGSEPDQMYKAATYYAKFEKDVADLKIVKEGWDTADENQSFIFTITGKANTNTAGVENTVIIHPNKDGGGELSAVLKDLPVGEYTVTEDTNWSWRYTPKSDKQNPESQTVTITASSKGDKIVTVTFKNERTEFKWLNGSSWCKNVFKDGKIIQTRTTTNNSED